MSESRTPPPLDDRPMPGVDAAASNAAMADKILQLPVQPYQDGGYVVRVSEIVGRRSGVRRRVPIAVTQVDGVRYLVSPSARRPWARNLVAAGACDLLSAAGREHCRAVPAPPGEALTVVRVYLAQLRWAAAQFPFAADAADDVILGRLDEIAVFRLEPLDAPAAS